MLSKLELTKLTAKFVTGVIVQSMVDKQVDAKIDQAVSKWNKRKQESH